jgi:energy-coupling factor transporter ATP-binding protein EcfA2
MDITKIDYVGVLPSNEEIQNNGIGRDTVFINANDALQFNVKIISQTPGELPNIKFFVGYSNKFPEFHDNKAFNEDERIAEYYEELDKWFIGFNYKMNNNGFPVLDRIMKKSKLSTYKPGNTYVSVPTYRKDGKLESENFIYGTLEDLLLRIKENKYLGTIEGFVNDKSTPQYIIWDDGEDKYAIGIFNDHKYAHGGFCFNYDQLKYIKFEEKWYDEIFDFEENKKITYVESEVNKEIILKLDATSPIDTVENQLDKVKEIEVATNTEDLRTEETLINQFELIAKNEGLYYDRKDLINFHTAVKTNALVILAGMSGTGKSRLVRCYAKALGIIEDEGFKVIPVRPSWNDDSDLIGYVDSMHMVYKASDNGFVKFLLNASNENNKDKLYIVCLDEMNLARVEQYFSQFLSILEMPEKERKLELYDASITLYNSAEYKREIEIKDNIKFIGTVNMDESTFHFSDKVLDRANVIKLNVLPYVNWEPISVTEKAKIMQYNWTYAQYKEYIKKENAIPLMERERLFIWEIHKLFNKVNKNLGVGPRIIRKIDSYLENLQKGLELSRKEALDIQFVQRVLTKLRGPKEQLQSVFIESEGNERTIYSILEEYHDISDFSRTKAVLDEKRQELKIYGYTL